MNGSSPVPRIPTSIMDMLTLANSWTYDAISSGYKDGAAPPAYLYVVGDGDGHVSWAAAEDVPEDAGPCLVNSIDAVTLSNCSLGQDGFTLTADGNSFRLHANPGTSRVYLAEV